MTMSASDSDQQTAALQNLQNIRARLPSHTHYKLILFAACRLTRLWTSLVSRPPYWFLVQPVRPIVWGLWVAYPRRNITVGASFVLFHFYVNRLFANRSAL